jgi:hypothetical protein
LAPAQPAPPAQPAGPAATPGPAAGGEAPAPQQAQGADSGEGSQPRYSGPPLPPPGRFYADAEFLLWFSKPNKLPPLVTIGAFNDISSTAALGEPGTTVVFGDHGYDSGARVGLRLRAGAWLNDEETFGIEAGGFWVEPSGTDFRTASNGDLPLGIPFANAEEIVVSPETALLLASPTLFSGAVSVSTRNAVWGFEGDARLNLTGGEWYRADLLAGLRYLRLTDDLAMNSSISALPGGFVQFAGQVLSAPATVAISDRFRTVNDFYGGQLGGAVELRRDGWFADFRGTLALGDVHQAVTINGSTSLTVPNAPPVAVNGGLFAQATNIGRHTRNEFGIVPEGNVTVGYQITSFLRATVGYSALYFRNDVLRTGTAVDRQVGQSQIPALFAAPVGTPARPAVLLNNVDFWVQGVHFGVELDF